MADIITIDTGVNCYLIKGGSDFILVDTGFASKRQFLADSLESAGCRPGNLKLIVLTHGDIDHTGNCLFLKENYGPEILMHSGDTGMVENGDMNWNRSDNPDKYSVIFRMISLIFGRSMEFDRFKPDLAVEDGFDLSGYGLNGKIVHIPGHSKGSIGILLDNDRSGKVLFCGDLLVNLVRPGFHFYIDSMASANASVNKLAKMKINTVYPGHGKPFAWESFMKRFRR